MYENASQEKYGKKTAEDSSMSFWVNILEIYLGINNFLEVNYFIYMILISSIEIWR